MSALPSIGLDPQEQQRRIQQLYSLLGEQVKSYHKARHMGEHSSIRVELAQELMQSMLYTLDQVGGMEGNSDISLGLEKGQKILEDRLAQGKQLFRLVEATAPAWQGECRWDTVQALGRFLRSYDWKHLAHKLPEGAYYPLLVPVPEQLQGIDHALFFLQALWLENQIMAAFPDKELDGFWSVFCQNDRGISENQCEQLLVNVMGKVLISGKADTLVFSDKERDCLQVHFSQQSSEMMEKMLSNAFDLLDFPDPNAISYARQVILNLLSRLTAAVGSNNLATIFI